MIGWHFYSGCKSSVVPKKSISFFNRVIFALYVKDSWQKTTVRKKYSDVRIHHTNKKINKKYFNIVVMDMQNKCYMHKCCTSGMLWCCWLVSIHNNKKLRWTELNWKSCQVQGLVSRQGAAVCVWLLRGSAPWPFRNRSVTLTATPTCHVSWLERVLCSSPRHQYCPRLCWLLEQQTLYGGFLSSVIAGSLPQLEVNLRDTITETQLQSYSHTLFLLLSVCLSVS